MNTNEKLAAVIELSECSINIDMDAWTVAVIGQKKGAAGEVYVAARDLDKALDKLLTAWGYSEAMLSREYVVRVVDYNDGNKHYRLSDHWKGLLAFGGIIQFHEESPCWDILCPGGNSKEWAEKVAEHLRENGVNAECAPKWQE